MRKALFVCTGNTCRSPMAACLFTAYCQKRGLDWVGDCAGLYANEGDAASSGAALAMRKRGLSLADHAAKPVTAALIEQSALVVGMTGEHAGALRERFSEHADKIIAFSPPIPDPFGGSPWVYERAAQAIEEGLKSLADTLSDRP